MKAYIGLDIGGTKILGVLYKEDGTELDRAKKKTKASEGVDVVIEQIYKVVDKLLEESKVELMGIGAGSPGLIKDEGIVVFSPNIPFVDFDLKGKIVKRYGCAFVLGNDVNVAMFGEWKHTGLDQARSVVGLFIGTGIGGAIIINGELYLGQGSAGEMGHMVVQDNGMICGCGSKGCFEAYASKTAMQKFINAQIKKGRQSILEEAMIDGGVIKSSVLENAYNAKDPLAIEVIDEAIHYMGVATANYVNIFHPEIFIFSGGVIESFGQPMLSRIIDEARKHSMPGLVDDVDFRLSELGDDAGAYGGYALIRSKVST